MLGAYRWVVEVAFLFAAFTEYPSHKWSIGLGLLAFDGAVTGIGHAISASIALGLVNADLRDRKTRTAIVLAAEQARGKAVDAETFWGTVDRRVEREYEQINEYADKPAGFWSGLGLALAAFAWQLLSTLVGIALVAGLTS